MRFSRLLPFFISAVTAFAASSCSGEASTSPCDNSPFASEATARAKADARRAIDAPAGSMQRESAILDIHARAHRIALTGDSATARVYLNAAIAELDSAGVFDFEPERED